MFYSIGLDMTLIGAQFASSGVSITFHKDDHAMAAIEKRGIYLTAGTYNKFDVEPVQVYTILI